MIIRAHFAQRAVLTGNDFDFPSSSKWAAILVFSSFHLDGVEPSGEKFEVTELQDQLILLELWSQHLIVSLFSTGHHCSFKLAGRHVESKSFI